MSSYMGWELQDVNGAVVTSGGQNAGETWQDYTYYDYCLPINDSCDARNPHDGIPTQKNLEVHL